MSSRSPSAGSSARASVATPTRVSTHGTPMGGAGPQGNAVAALVHGSTYFPRGSSRRWKAPAPATVWFTDWRGDPDERLDGAGTEVGARVRRRRRTREPTCVG